MCTEIMDTTVHTTIQQEIIIKIQTIIQMYQRMKPVLGIKDGLTFTTQIAAGIIITITITTIITVTAVTK